MSGSDRMVETIYVDLDCLLDTRIGTLAKMDEDLAAQVLAGNYHQRTDDFFAGVDHEAYKAAYAQRDVDTLMLSLFTNVITFLQACVKSATDEVALGGQNNGLEIVINVHPYELEPEEREQIELAIKARLFGVPVVRTTKVPDEFLTPEYVKETYGMMIRYDFEPWLEKQAQALEKTRIPAVTIISPAIYRKLPTDEEMAALKAEKLHPFRALEIALAPVVGVRLLDAEVFSIHSGIKRSGMAPAAPVQVAPEAPVKPAEPAPQSEGGEDWSLL